MQQEIKYPKPVFLIIGFEFCERFAFYGLRGKWHDLSLIR